MTGPRFIRNPGEDSIKNDRSSSSTCPKDGKEAHLHQFFLLARQL